MNKTCFIFSTFFCLHFLCSSEEDFTGEEEEMPSFRGKGHMNKSNNEKQHHLRMGFFFLPPAVTYCVQIVGLVSLLC